MQQSKRGRKIERRVRVEKVELHDFELLLSQFDTLSAALYSKLCVGSESCRTFSCVRDCDKMTSMLQKEEVEGRPEFRWKKVDNPQEFRWKRASTSEKEKVGNFRNSIWKRARNLKDTDGRESQQHRWKR